MNYRAFAITVLMIPISLVTSGAASRNLDTLLSEYSSLPTYANERQYEHLLNNVMLDEVPHPQLENVEQTIIRKQFLLGEIYERSFVEFQGDGIAEKFIMLFFGGQLPGQIAPMLPSIERLSNARTLFSVISKLTKREHEVAVLALEILKLSGPRYPSTDSFARGLARYAAESAVNALQFDEALTVFDRLYELKRIKPSADGAKSYDAYRIGSIGGEISNPVYNPSIKDPRLKTAVVTNMLAQIGKRIGETRYDLIAGLGPIENDRRIDLLLASILFKSIDASELRAAMLAVSLRPENRVLKRIIKSQIDRYAAISPNPLESSSPLRSAMDTLTGPFWRNELTAAKATRPLILDLFKHEDSRVRQHAIVALESHAFSDQEVEKHIRTFLTDRNEGVRMTALDNFWRVRSRLDSSNFSADLLRISESDPSDTVKKMANETRDYLASKLGKQCQSLFRVTD